MKTIGLFVDVSNLYFSIARRYRGRKLDYLEYYKFIQDFGEVRNATAYGTQAGREASAFIHRLQKLGYATKYKKRVVDQDSSWNVGIAIDVMEVAKDLDIIVLGSSDDSLTPLVHWLSEKGIKVIVIACNVSYEIEQAATEVIEIPESLLEKRRDEAPKTEGA